MFMMFGINAVISNQLKVFFGYMNINFLIKSTAETVSVINLLSS